MQAAAAGVVGAAAGLALEADFPPEPQAAGRQPTTRTRIAASGRWLRASIAQRYPGVSRISNFPVPGRVPAAPAPPNGVGENRRGADTRGVMTPLSCGCARPQLVGLAVAFSSLLGLAGARRGRPVGRLERGFGRQRRPRHRHRSGARYRHALRPPHGRRPVRHRRCDAARRRLLRADDARVSQGGHEARALHRRPVEPGPHRFKVSQLRPGDLVFFFSDHHHVGIYMATAS